MKLVIVGGVAGGMSAATRARRLNENAEIIVLEKGKHVSFANCGLPYYIGGTIRQRDELLVVTPKRLRERFDLDVRPRNEVTRIDREKRQVTVRDLIEERTYTEHYDRLILAPGASPFRPPIPGIGDSEVYTLRNLEDMDRIHAAAETAERERRALIIGGGFIGLEMAENLVERGFRVAIAEMLPQVMTGLDPEMASLVQRELERQGVGLFLGNAVQRIERHGDELHVTLQDGTTLGCDFAVLAAGIRPNTELAREAGLEIGETGGIRVDEHLRTSDPSIYAVGDAIETTDYVTGRPILLPLAGPANRQGRTAADNACGRDSVFRGVQGTAIVKVFQTAAANTGANEKTLNDLGWAFEKVYIHPNSHAGYYPGAAEMTFKLLFSTEDGRVLGAQIVGSHGVDKRIDVVATAIQAHMSVFDLEEAELAYAPPFGSAKDPVNMAAFVAANYLRGDVQIAHTDELPDERVLLDVRTPGEYESGHIPDALNLPLDQLRDRLDDAPAEPLAIYCGVGLRSYIACRILAQHGYDVVNLSGGFRTYCQYHHDQQLAAETPNRVRRAFTVDADSDQA